MAHIRYSASWCWPPISVQTNQYRHNCSQAAPTGPLIPVEEIRSLACRHNHLALLGPNLCLVAIVHLVGTGAMKEADQDKSTPVDTASRPGSGFIGDGPRSVRSVTEGAPSLLRHQDQV